ncbi:hypothetical protein EHE19_012965 [Ruminiclostridium herbifermentans]|uniref:Uncharacterized protein n=1 Tax=Ruminiclostridium herbifermentans TaxID=2488810 RepID=A0A4U7JDQ5_9FIRM|nr:hypothetical protein [Ruminiclostridium herbifermentans]QNU65809.1 hypothetical protein EHE19_012965 [Ruminiclostridium herbifermentans]
MKKKRNIRSEIQKLLRPNKGKKLNEEQIESAAEDQAEAENKVILAEDESLEPKNEVEAEFQKNESVEPKAEEKAEAQSENQEKLEDEEEADAQPEKQAEPEAEEKAEAQSENQEEPKAEEEAEAQMENQEKLEAEEKAEAQSENQKEAEAEEKAEVQPGNQAELEVVEKAEVQPGNQEEPKAEKKAEVQLENQEELEAEEEAEAQSENQEELEAEEKAEAQLENQAEPEAEEKAEVQPGNQEEAEAEEETEVLLENQEKLETEEEAEVQLENQEKLEDEEEAEAQSENQAEPEAEEKAEAQSENQAEPEAEEKAEAQSENQEKLEAEEEAEAQSENQAELEAEEEAEAQPENQAEPEAEGKAEVQPRKHTELQIESNIKLGIKNIRQSSVKNIKYGCCIQIKPEMNTSIVLKNQPYVNFSKMIMGKYGFERLDSTFSKLIFRQFQMMLREDRSEANVENSRIVNNYNSFFYINKPVFNILSQSIALTSVKSNKEISFPFYIIKHSHLNSGNESSNGLKYEKETLKFLPKSILKGEQISRNSKEEKMINSLEKSASTISNFYNLHYMQKAQEKFIESKKEEILDNPADRITKIISEPINILSGAQAFEKRIETLATKIQMNNSVTNISYEKAIKPAVKLLFDSNHPSKLRALIPESSRSINLEGRSLSNRTSIGSSTKIINISKIDITNRNTNADINRSVNRVDGWTINEKNYVSSNGPKNAGNLIITNVFKNGITNLAINRPINETTNLTVNRPNNEIINLAINKINNQASNGSSIKTIKNNFITNKVLYRLENIDESNRYPQIPLMKNSHANNESFELKPTEVESAERVKQKIQEIQEIAIEDIKKSEIILRTTLAKKDSNLKTKELLKSTLVQADSAISRLIKNYSNKQNAEDEEETANKINNYQNRTRLIPAEIKQATKLNGISNFTGNLLEDSNLIFYKPPVKEKSKETQEAQKVININDEKVFAKTVTSVKPQSKYSQIEVEEVNLIADRVFRIIEKRIAIQKDRRGLR